jgi:TolB protein
MIAKWSGDGSRIIYTDMVDGNPEIFSCLADGSAEVRLTQSELFEQRPCWSHSGQKIAFSATTGQANNIAGYEIYVMNADGTNVIKLTENNILDGSPQWSADDSLLLFESERASPGRGDVFVMNADGSNVRQVTRTTAPAMASLPVWRPGR